MSFVFEVDGETVWSPALRVGQAFVGCAQALGQVVVVFPGFSFNAEDMIELDPLQLESYVMPSHRYRGARLLIESFRT